MEANCPLRPSSFATMRMPISSSRTNLVGTPGESFTQAGVSSLYSAPRAEDSEEEIIACVDALYQALILAVKKHWASALSKNEAVTLCNTLLNAPGGNGVFTICKDAHVSCYDLAEAWNSAHPNDEQIEYHPASII